MVFAPLLGRLSDRLGRRPVILFSIAGSVAAYLGFAAATSFTGLLVARTLSGVAAANLGIAQAYVADVTPPEKRSQGMGMIGAAFGLGFIGGPALGGLLGLAGHTAVALGAAGLAAINFTLALVWLPEAAAVVRAPTGEAGDQAGAVPAAPRRSWFDPRRLALLGRDPALLGLMVLFFLVTFCFSLMEATMALVCQARFGFGQVETSWLFVLAGVVMVGVQGGLVGVLTTRFGERRLALVGMALMAGGLLGMAEAQRVLLLAAAAGVLAVGNGLYMPSYLAMLSRVTADDAQGGTLGLSRSFSALARVLGPPAGTWLFASVGVGWPLWAGGGLMAAALVFGWPLLRRLGPRLATPGDGDATPAPV
jgi:MFS family permease